MVRIARDQRADTLRSVEAAEKAALAAQDTVAAMREIDQRQAADFKASIAAAQKAAEAADLSAKAAIGVELPSLHVENVTATLQDSHSFNEWIKSFSIRISIRNYGRTPAFITEVIVNMMACKNGEVPNRPIYKEFTIVPRQLVVPPGQATEFTEYSYFNNCHFSEEDISNILSGDINIYVYGVIRFRDFLDADHAREYIFIYVENQGSFMPIFHREEYYYQT